MANLTEAEIAEFKEAFSLFDRDGDGVVAPTDVPLIMRSLGHNPDDKEIASYGTSKVDFKKFLELAGPKLANVDVSQQLISKFQLFDRERNGTINTSELLHVLKNLGDRLSEQDIAELIKAADPQGSGQIVYANFVKLLMTK